jgi:hypothetical protein
MFKNWVEGPEHGKPTAQTFSRHDMIGLSMRIAANDAMGLTSLT